MTDINQNFSLVVQNDTDVAFDIGPDEAGTNLEFAESITWKAYTQLIGVPHEEVISKEVGAGITIDDPLLMLITVAITGADTIGLAGNYYYEIKMVANLGRLVTTTTGLMTVIDPTHVPNVFAFKATFPEYASVDDTTVQIALDQAGHFVDSSWGAEQTAGQMYLAAHFMAVAHATGDTDGRAVTSETIGRMSISYASGVATGSATDSLLGATRYGLIFSNMLNAQGFGIAVV